MYVLDHPLAGDKRVRPSFLGFHRLMNAFRDHADRGVQQSYAISHFSECVLMDSHGRMDPFIARCLVRATSGSNLAFASCLFPRSVW